MVEPIMKLPAGINANLIPVWFVRVCGRLDMFEVVGFGFVAAGFDDLGFVVPGLVELFAASKVFRRFSARLANSPLGYFFKYTLKSSGFVLSLIEVQKIISAADVASLADFAG